MSVLPSLQERNHRASILTSVIVCLYATYLVWSAIVSQPSATPACVYQTEDNGDSVFSIVVIVVGAVITFVAVAFTTTRAGSHTDTAPSESSRLIIQEEKASSDDEKNSVNKDVDEEDIEVQKRKEQERRDHELLNLDGGPNHNENAPAAPAYNYTWFHVVMMLGAMYIGCLLTNWQVFSYDGTSTTTSHLAMTISSLATNAPSKLVVDRSIVSMWLKLASSWVVILLYVWTLIAPLVLTNRDFS